jgi:hypothetical protein
MEQFNRICESLENGQFKQAAEIMIENNYTAIDLIHMNNDAKENWIPIENENGDFDICGTIKNETHIALIVQIACDMREEQRNKTEKK